MTNLPILVNRKGGKRIIEVRRESNVELLQQALLRESKIKLRVMIQIKVGHRNYGYQGAAFYHEVASIAEAREYVERLKGMK